MFGFWELVSVSYGHEQLNKYKTDNVKRQVKKRESKRLEIIDPKTGKPIKMGGKPPKKKKQLLKRKVRKVRNVKRNRKK